MSMRYRDNDPPNEKGPTGTVEPVKNRASTTTPPSYHTDPSGCYTGVWISEEPGQIIARRRDEIGRHLTAYLPTRAALTELLSRPGGLCARTADVIIGGIR